MATTMSDTESQERNDVYWQPAICSCVFRDDYGNTSFCPEIHIPLLAQYGFKHLELTCYLPERDFDWKNSNKIKELTAICDDNGINIWSTHPPENEVLLGDSDKLRQENLDMLKAFADFSAQLDVSYMPIHLWSQTKTYQQAKQELILDQVIASLDEISRNQGVMPCLETLRANVSKVKNTELLDILNNNSLHLGMVMDTGHAQISGELNEITLASGLFLKSLHLHDNNGIDDTHQVPGTGVIDWGQFRDSLKHINYTGPIMYEIGYIRNHDLEAALKKTIEHYNTYFQ